ncbi:MAG: hypothetical protein COZ80_02010 [Ignavibacteria bacterium CG_4_8_14_3_um_filter_37_9]|nr:isoprenylcysteine carboxylmethyltransferase family protein [Ignavibacteria bacterium]OIO13669.1 MAG: hypothetical protein AUJ54_15850 [Ignavibacteria bacterium CG1_02_37_35]PIP77410.1 MAG: hypothetical protein COW85_09115 [Ignavibacteria bacterium CG22_combo_CG10-13_8_21_14_all_37_15]PIS44413.1 MAG: hypothetical protein COT22_10660 [Ignavibacteria bacterium CG08_land_8_20_14_0_20_37_9]PIX00084.1 MAG: hypothetical protein COZ80_02010 [Ignavibacteria bacterium CG_4_8_14_3_um_filter_37_9]PIX92
MILLGNIFLLVFLFLVFGWLHSLFASNKIKEAVRRRFPQFLPFYRLTYNVLSLFTFFLFWTFSPKPDVILYDLSFPFDFLILVPQFFSLLGLIWTLKFVDGKEFLGISQIQRWKTGTYKVEELDETSVLRIEGPYKFSRHPVYLFSIFFLLFRPTMNLFSFLFVLCSTIYFYIGSRYEEKKLVARFGGEYVAYQKNVSKIFPTKPLLRFVVERFIWK